MPKMYYRQAFIKTPCEYRCLHCGATNKFVASKCVMGSTLADENDNSELTRDFAASSIAYQLEQELKKEKNFLQKEVDQYKEYIDSGKLGSYVGSYKILKKTKNIASLSYDKHKCESCGSKQIWQIDTKIKNNVFKIWGISWAISLAIIVLLTMNNKLDNMSPLFEALFAILMFAGIYGGLLGPYIYYHIKMKKLKKDAKDKIASLSEYLPKVTGESQYDI